jgi:hypothetical protein
MGYVIMFVGCFDKHKNDSRFQFDQHNTDGNAEVLPANFAQVFWISSSNQLLNLTRKIYKLLKIPYKT